MTNEQQPQHSRHRPTTPTRPTRKTENRTVLISGAGIAGPALAYWLGRYGFRPTIVERAPALREGGYAVDFRGEAHLSVLERMGILAGVRAAQTHMGSMAYVNSAGREVSRMPADVFSGDLEILRGDLGRILHDATKERTEYVFGDSITGLAEDADGVTVEFERGEPRRFELVVGADGVHSTVRSLAFGPEDAYVRPTGLYSAIFTTPNHLGLDHAGRAYLTPGRLVAVYSARNNTEAKAVFYFAAPDAPGHDRHDRAEQQRIVSRAYAGNGWETERLLAAMPSAADFWFDSISAVRMDSWSRGRVALLGDAAWCPTPLSGMGTGLAVVGAYVLAGELAAADGDHLVAFARYQEVMDDYVRGCAKQADGVANWMVPGNRFMAWFVHQNYRLLPYVPWKGRIAASIRRTANAIDLADYGPRGSALAGRDGPGGR